MYKDLQECREYQANVTKYLQYVPSEIQSSVN